MSEKDDGGKAFPWCGDLNECPTINLGMSLRDYIAVAALQTFGRRIYDERYTKGCKRGVYPADELAETCYVYADAMLKARAK